MIAAHRLVLVLLLVVPPAVLLTARDGTASSVQAPPADSEARAEWAYAQ